MSSTTTASGGIPDSSNNKNPSEPQRKGNLHSLLKAFDAQNNNNNNNSNNNNYSNDNTFIGGGLDHTANVSDSISIQFENVGRERSSTLGSLRERGLTFGSEFDLGLGLTNDNVSQDAVFDLSAVNVNGNAHGGNNSNGGGAANHTINQKMNNVVMGPSTGGPSGGIASGAAGAGACGALGTGDHQHHNSQTQEMQETSSQTSGHGFLNKMFSHNHQSEGQTSSANATIRDHTPPTSVATSYEIKHFGKRLRSGVSLGFDFGFCSCSCFDKPYYDPFFILFI